MGELLMFGVLAAVVALSSVMVIVSRHPMTCALYLLLDIMGISALYALMGAEFVAAIQVILYAGAILVLFLFVIMMLRMPELPKRPVGLSEILVGLLTVAGFGFVALKIMAGGVGDRPVEAASAVAGAGNTVALGLRLFTDYLWPFELASIVILLAIVAAVVIGRGARSGSAAINNPTERKS